MYWRVSGDNLSLKSCCSSPVNTTVKPGWQQVMQTLTHRVCKRKQGCGVCFCRGKKKRHYTRTALFPAQALQRCHKYVSECSAASRYHKPETGFHWETRTLFWAHVKLMQWQIHRTTSPQTFSTDNVVFNNQGATHSSFGKLTHKSQWLELAQHTGNTSSEFYPVRFC